MIRRRKNYLAIQQELIKKYRMKLNPDSKCWERLHVHPKVRMICKWKPRNSIVATFDLMHEIGHCENNKSWMRTAEEEYYATVWALDQCKKYDLSVPFYLWKRFQDYIDMEKNRGIRRGGKGYGTLQLPTDMVE